MIENTYQVHELKQLKKEDPALVTCWGDKLTFSQVQRIKSENRFTNFIIKRNI